MTVIYYRTAEGDYVLTPETTPARRIGNPRCGSRATWHIAWQFTPRASFSLVCDDHMSECQGKFVYIDRHRAEMVCDMPGTGWRLGEPSRCVVPPDEIDQPFLAAREAATA